MKRHELTDEQWDLIKPFIPVSHARTGRPARDRRTLLHAIFWILHGSIWLLTVEACPSSPRSRPARSRSPRKSNG